MKYPAAVVSLGMGICLVLAFQNCGQAMKGTGGSISASSVQCLAKAAASTLSEKAMAGQLNCTNADFFHCEKRVFQPNIAPSVAQEMVCITDLVDCAKAKITSFDTSHASKVPETDPAEFELGGEYNRSEVSCAYVEDGHVLLREENQNLKSALAAVVQSCRDAMNTTGTEVGVAQ